MVSFYIYISFHLVPRIPSNPRAMDTLCRTIGGPSSNKECIFPFKFEVYLESSDTIKDTHDACIQDDSGVWCSTKVDEEGYHFAGSNNWGTCTPECPVFHTKTGEMNRNGMYVIIIKC